MPLSIDLPLVAAETPQWRYRLWLCSICAGMLLFFAQVTMLYPVLPLYLMQRWNNPPVGLTIGAMAAGLLCFRPAIGWLIDRWGRKPVLWLGLAIVLLISPLYVWSPSPAGLMGVRVLHGIGQAAFATASQTMLADLVPPARRSTWLGYLAMSNTIGFAVGPLLGAWLFAHYSFGAVALTMASLTLLGVGLSLPLPWLKASSAQRQSADRSAWQLVSQFPVRDATLLFLVSSTLHGAVVTYLPLFVADAALFYSLNALVAVLVRFGLGRWGDRLSSRWVVSLGILASGIALIGLAIAPQWLGLWSVLYGLGFGSLFPVLSTIVSLAAPAAVRGRVYSVFLAGFDGGMTLGSAIGQPIGQLLSFGGLFLLLGSLGSSSSLIALRQFSRPIDVK